MKRVYWSSNGLKALKSFYQDINTILEKYKAEDFSLSETGLDTLTFNPDNTSEYTCTSINAIDFTFNVLKERLSIIDALIESAKQQENN